MINVCDDSDYFRPILSQLIDGMVSDWDGDLDKIVTLCDGHTGRGYSLSTSSELATICDVAQHTGVFLDPSYSGKAFCGLQAMMASQPEQFAGKRILFWHTGGGFALASKLPQLMEVLPTKKTEVLTLREPVASKPTPPASAEITSTGPSRIDTLPVIRA